MEKDNAMMVAVYNEYRRRNGLLLPEEMRLTGFASEYWSCHFSVQGTEYRIDYEIRDKEVIVYVLQIGSRENFYKTFKGFFRDNMQKF